MVAGINFQAFPALSKIADYNGLRGFCMQIRNPFQTELRGREWVLIYFSRTFPAPSLPIIKTNCQ